MPVFKFNTAIAKMMEALNTMNEEQLVAGRAELATLAKIIAPVAPFTAERCWVKLDLPGSVHDQTWPEFDASLDVVEKVVVAVQVNGKLRGTVEIDTGCKGR